MAFCEVCMITSRYPSKGVRSTSIQYCIYTNLGELLAAIGDGIMCVCVVYNEDISVGTG